MISKKSTVYMIVVRYNILIYLLTNIILKLFGFCNIPCSIGLLIFLRFYVESGLIIVPANMKTE